eukprot:365884-Chlamydomonas_euryale.AAC.2
MHSQQGLCTHLAGFQVLVEDVGGFGSLAHSVLQELSSEYSREVLLFSLRRSPSVQPAAGSAAARWVSTTSTPRVHYLPTPSMHAPIHGAWGETAERLPNRHVAPHLCDLLGSCRMVCEGAWWVMAHGGSCRMVC